MLKLLRLFKPPEWSWWTIRDRVAYFVSLACAMLLLGLGANALREIILRWLGD